MGVQSLAGPATIAGVVGGFAPLDSGILVPRSYLPTVAGLLHNLAASAAPAVGDDSGDGYGVGSMWLDTTNDNAYLCIDATASAAIWRRVGTGVWTSYTPTFITSGAGADPTVGNGTLSGLYRRLDSQTIDVDILWQFGSSSAAGSGAYLFGLPSGITANGSQSVSAWLADSSAGTFWAGAGVAGWFSGTEIAVAIGTNSAVVGSATLTWATSDTLVINGRVKIA